ncbi:M1 family metallopeptidase [Roseateles sp.]|uniref:M1 family metallopeptidase n=1 Tax=Roseateles sp. TaxID=1971397 RepID=UPI00286B657F|nr:M1 family metallopeptidase [Roseateles sp.]
MIAIRCLLLTLAVAAQGALAQPRFDFDTTPGRLLKSVMPEHYTLSLALDPDAEHFSGQAVLSLRVRHPVAFIVLHARELKATRAQLGKRLLVVTPDEQTQTWTLTPTDGAPIAAGMHRLELDYDGQVRNNGSGLFQSPHQALGKPVRLLATQLQAVYARTVFPSFDEPAFRTVFELAVRAPKGYEVLSNMNQTSAVDEGSMRVHRFAPTPPMPSYLVAVAVGRFDSLSSSAAGVPLRVLSAPGKREQGAYALEALQKLLPYYNDYFGIPYALPKLDLLAVPSNRQGAMEDWGLISFAESTLLFDPATSGTQAQRFVFSLVAHEVAHQWFGNLVTAASWEEIWLNEAFATWLAEKATNRFNPAWQVLLRRRLDIEEAMARDATAATRAIRSGPVPEDRVFDVFDGITYDKGGAVLTMLEHWIGADAFRRGLGEYMQARRLSSATAGDLWFHIGKASARNVSAVAASWTDQPGFPLVTVATRCVGGKTRVELNQQRFTTSGEAGTALWQIPVVLSHGGALSTVLLDRPARSLVLPGCPPQPTLVNPAGDGFYRVAYGPAQQAALTANYAALPASVQVALLSDTFALAQAGRLPMTAYLDLLVALPRAQGPGRAALFAQARAGLDFLARSLAASPAEAPLFTAARALLAPELEAVGWLPRAGEDSETEALRNSLIRQLARFDDPATIERARALFDADEAGREPLPAAIRAAVVSATGRHADAPRFAQLMERLQKAQSEKDRRLFAGALASTRDPAQARRVMELSLTGELPNNIAPWLPGMVGDESAHAAMAYAFVVEHWAELAEKTGGMFGARAWLLPAASESFNEPAAARRLLADQQRLAGDPGTAPALQVAAQIELRSVIRARESEQLGKALEALLVRMRAML